MVIGGQGEQIKVCMVNNTFLNQYCLQNCLHPNEFYGGL